MDHGGGAVTAGSLLERAELERSAGRGPGPRSSTPGRPSWLLAAGTSTCRSRRVLGLARCQPYNETPGALPVRLHEPYVLTRDATQRSRLASALARCWAYAGEPRRARPFAGEALAIAEGSGDAVLLADALDAGLTAWWGPDELERGGRGRCGCGDVAAHLPDPDARLQAAPVGADPGVGGPRRPAGAPGRPRLELLAGESPKARFFAASRRLALDLFRGRTDTLTALRLRRRGGHPVTLDPRCLRRPPRHGRGIWPGRRRRDHVRRRGPDLRVLRGGAAASRPSAPRPP